MIQSAVTTIANELVSLTLRVNSTGFPFVCAGEFLLEISVSPEFPNTLSHMFVMFLAHRLLLGAICFAIFCGPRSKEEVVCWCPRISSHVLPPFLKLLIERGCLVGQETFFAFRMNRRLIHRCNTPQNAFCNGKRHASG